MGLPITSLNLFRSYGRREDYEEQTGLPCPVWNEGRHPQAWCDPKAKKTFSIGGVPYTLYARVFINYDEVVKQPIWEELVIPTAEAQTVNIPPKGLGMTNVPGADQPDVPCPVRELADDEVISAVWGAIPMVFKTGELEAVVVGFTAGDRVLLERIAAKLGA
jgi:hypothetical protein